MSRFLMLACAAILTPTPAMAQSVPEGVHEHADGPSSVCGVTGSNALAIRGKLRADPAIDEDPMGSERFEVYFSSVDSKQWTFTKATEPAYPAITCVHLYNSDGATQMNRDMRCDASREECDELFVEFQASDERIRKQLQGSR